MYMRALIFLLLFCFLQVQCRRWVNCKSNYSRLNQPKHWVKTWIKSYRFAVLFSVSGWSHPQNIITQEEMLKLGWLNSSIILHFILKEDLADLKEQITLYESAVKHGVVALDLNGDWENQLSESCMDLGLKKTNWKNGTLHRYNMIIEPSWL